MQETNSQFVKCAAAFAVIAVLVSCSVNVKKEQDGQDKQVDIKTPMGSVHVGKSADPADVGLTIYPGATLREHDDNGNDNKGANVSVSGFGYGVKVAALEYESVDAPSKLVTFYQDQLKKYGSVLTCRTGHFDIDTDLHDRSTSHDLTCNGSTGVDVEMKVGTKENQHIVVVEPNGTGSKFSVVYVRTHGKDADI
jgi:hypothetical protein